MFHNNLDNKTYYNHKGYILLYYPEHPYCWKNGCIYLHKLVMENYLDRYLDNFEVIHHIDNNPLNNDIENLELMNNISHVKLHHIQKGNSLGKEKYCKQCNNKFSYSDKDTQFCSRICFDLNRRKAIRPTKEELHKLVWSMSTIDVAKQFNVSDVAISKWCKSYRINKPPRGYWAKVYSGKI